MSDIKGNISNFNTIQFVGDSYAIEMYPEESDFSKLCRTCLKETTDNDLTNESLCIINVKGKLIRLYEMFEIATGLQIEPDDKLPHHLCSTCLVSVNDSYTYRMQSQKTNEILRNILQKVCKEEAIDSSNHLTEEFVDQDEETIDEAALIEETLEETLDIPEESMQIERLEDISEPEPEPEPGEEIEAFNMEVDINSFPCDYCEKTFSRQRDLIQHYKDNHPKEKPFKCPDCSQSFAHIQSMRRHKKTHAERSKEKMCPLCSKLFHRSDDLKRHIRTHTDERPFQCSNCPKAFKQQTELKDHLLSHNDYKKYRCALCMKEWRSRNGWYFHLKAHQEGRDLHMKRLKKKGLVRGEEPLELTTATLIVET